VVYKSLHFLTHNSSRDFFISPAAGGDGGGDGGGGGGGGGGRGGGDVGGGSGEAGGGGGGGLVPLPSPFPSRLRGPAMSLSSSSCGRRQEFP
jgi:hypothetical protein